MRDLNLCKAFFFSFDFQDPIYSKVTFQIPTTVLPLSVSVVNGFYQSPYLIQCTIEFNLKDPYKSTPQVYKFTNPSYDETFPGSILLKDRFYNFFKNDYHPSHQYRCQNYILAPQVTTDHAKMDELVKILVDEGFPSKKAEYALLFCSYNINEARDYLVSGLIDHQSFPLPVNYADCPLFYLILEICEAFFDMGDCCCVCGKKLDVYHLKPTCCSDEKCQYSFLNLGVGSNIIGEIKRDPIATDLIVSLAGMAFNAPQNPPVFDPSPQSQGIKMDKKFFSELPSMKIICGCKNDSQLRDMIGNHYFEILRFFILANKAQFITLPSDMLTSIKVSKTQFLVTSVSPESEIAFRKKKDQFGNTYLWHGSLATRWYRIMHMGLKNMAGSVYQAHGGVGIYMSNSYYYSLGYCKCAENIYRKSCLPKSFGLISLIENASVKDLSLFSHTNNSQVLATPGEFTQQDESACITRVLFLIRPDMNYTTDYNVLTNRPTVPTLREVISHQMKKYI